MLTCREATALISRAEDGPLPWQDRIALRLHLLMCTYCARFERQLRFLDKVSRALNARTLDESTPAPPDAQRLSDEARERLKQTVSASSPR